MPNKFWYIGQFWEYSPHENARRHDGIYQNNQFFKEKSNMTVNQLLQDTVPRDLKGHT